jgi:hypothetical protein
MTPTATRIRLVAMLALALAPPAASATIYKCLLDDGGVFYQDAPCAPGRELRDFDKDPATVSVVPFQQPPSAAGQSASASGGKANGKARNGGASAKANGKVVPKPEAKSAKKSAERGDPTQRKFLRPGMSEGEVVARVGPPDMTSSGTRKGARWTYMPVAEDPNTITNLQFDNGRVVEVERKVLR